MNLPVCARKGCRRKVTVVAWREQDPYCSTGCLRADLQVPGWQDTLATQEKSLAQWGHKAQESRYAEGAA